MRDLQQQNAPIDFAGGRCDLRLCPSAHAVSRGRATTQSVPVGMHRICAAVCEPVSAVNRGRYPETKGEEGDQYYFLKEKCERQSVDLLAHQLSVAGDGTGVPYSGSVTSRVLKAGSVA